MKRFNFILGLTFLILLTFTSCIEKVNKSDYDKLQKELTECKKTIEELQNTPEIRLSKGYDYYEKKEFKNAKKELNTLIEKFGSSDEAKKAKSLLAEIDNQEQAKREAEERKRRLGYKSLKEKNSVTVGDVTVKFNSVSTGGDFVFDRYGDEWRYRDAERGEIYLLANVSVSAKTKGPKLPPISVYKNKNGTLNLIGTFEYRFYRWEDYGSYLGNDADYGNDFAHTSTIRFSCGLSILKEDLNNNAIFVVVKKQNCFYRSTNRFDNPPVSYNSSGCNLKPTLSVDDFDKDYVLVKILNKNKL